MALELVAEIALLAITVLLAVLTVELRRLVYAIVAFCGFGVAIGVLFLLLEAPYAAVFQFSIYAGAITALLLAAEAIVKGGEEGE